MSKKVAINVQFGGFSLSARAVARLAEIKGRKAYFFKGGIGKKYEPISVDDAVGVWWSAFDVPNPNEALPSQADWYALPDDEKRESNRVWGDHSLDTRPDDRSDPDLIRVIEELGDAANGEHATIKIIEIPDDVEWEIEEYDGNEHVAEKHRTWS